MKQTALFLMILLLLTGCGLRLDDPPPVPTLPAAPTPAALPISFIPNAGQMTGDAAFEAIGGSGSLRFAPGGVQIALPDGALTVEWLGANGDTAASTALRASVTGTNPLPGKANLYRGNNPHHWQTNLPTFAAVTYTNLYPGIDLVYDGSEGLLKGTYHVAPGADPAAIGWRYVGGTAVTLDETTGDLRITLNDQATLTEKAPVAYQVVNGRQQPITAAYRLNGDTVHFELGDYDPQRPLIIDPTLVYSSYFGGGSDDYGRDVAVDSSGNVYLVGNTYSSTLPGGSGGSGSSDLFVTKINAAGTAVLFTTIVGGSGGDYAEGVAVNTTGSKIWIAGSTTSDNLPTANAFQAVSGGSGDALVMQFNGSGGLVFSSYYGGYLYDTAADIALDSAGNAHLAGSIWGGFFAKVNGQTYQNEYERMIGGQEAVGHGIALDSQDNIYITGEIRSATWPTVNPVQENCGSFDDWTCSTDAFVVQLPPTGDDLLFSTYLGGSAGNGGSGTDIGRAIAVDGSGHIAVVGETFASDFPVANAAQGQKPGSSTMSAAFVTRLARQGAGYQVAFSTYLGGEGTDWATAVAMNNAGQVFVVGGTGSDAFPVAAAWQPQRGPGVCFSSTSRNCYDAFIAQFTPTGALPFSTYWGGTDDDVAAGLTLDSSGNLVVGGRTESLAFPVTAGGFQPNRAQGVEAFVLKAATGQTNPPPPPDLPFKVYVPMVIR
jgi:hypothetical protein